MSTLGSVSMSAALRVQQGLYPRAAIEALAAPEHGARAPLQAIQRAGRERRGEGVADFAQGDALAVTDHLGIGRVAVDARWVLPWALRGFRQVGHRDAARGWLAWHVEHRRHQQVGDMLGDAERCGEAGGADATDGQPALRQARNDLILAEL